MKTLPHLLAKLLNPNQGKTKRGYALGRLKTTLRLPEFHVLLFGFCFVLFGWPLILIAEKAHNVTLFVYLFAAWGIIIFLLFLIAGSLDTSGIDETENM